MRISKDLAQPCSQRAAYAAPRLQVYGVVGNLTQAGTGMNTEGVPSMNGMLGIMNMMRMT